MTTELEHKVRSARRSAHDHYQALNVLYWLLHDGAEGLDFGQLAVLIKILAEDANRVAMEIGRIENKIADVKVVLDE